MLRIAACAVVFCVASALSAKREGELFAEAPTIAGDNLAGIAIEQNATGTAPIGVAGIPSEVDKEEPVLLEATGSRRERKKQRSRSSIKVNQGKPVIDKPKDPFSMLNPNLSASSFVEMGAKLYHIPNADANRTSGWGTMNLAATPNLDYAEPESESEQQLADLSNLGNLTDASLAEKMSGGWTTSKKAEKRKNVGIKEAKLNHSAWAAEAATETKEAVAASGSKGSLSSIETVSETGTEMETASISPEETGHRQHPASGTDDAQKLLEKTMDGVVLLEKEEEKNAEKNQEAGVDSTSVAAEMKEEAISILKKSEIISTNEMVLDDEMKKLEMLSMYELMLDLYNQIPVLNWHTKLAILGCTLVILIAKMTCLCLCLRSWQDRHIKLERERALREAAKRMCSGQVVPNVDEAKVRAILGDLLDQDISEKVPEKTDSDDSEEGPEDHSSDEEPDTVEPSSLARTLATTLPPDEPVRWSIHYSQHGVPCFYNFETGEKTWTIPKDIKARMETGGKVSGAADSFSFPPGCELACDDSDDD
mmetsp:Transcript_3069/g.5690  ORF Transcript_3069/g.5690 Transcript_3069/m.5690 type:complete len:537 (-) Transcript_3069:108-1718(-)